MAIKKLILDLDMGVDDAMALAYAIASPEVELVGITTCFGNVRVEQSAHNCLAAGVHRAHSRQERHRRRERARVALRAGGGDLGRRQRRGRLSD